MRIHRVLAGVLTAMLPCFAPAQQDTLKEIERYRQLLQDVWGAEFTEHTHYLGLYMAQLRSKLEENSADPQLLMTEPGVGYRIAEPRA